MKKIQVLGPGCANCKKLAALADTCARELGMEYDLEKVTDITQIVNAGVLQTPAVAVDGKILHYGSVPSKGELLRLLQKTI